MFDSFTNTGNGRKALKELPAIDENKIYPFYLCVTNDTRRKYTKICTDHFCEDGIDVKFVYQGRNETYKLTEGTPIICTKNNADLKRFGVANNWKEYVSNISSSRTVFTVKGIMYDDIEGWIETEQAVEDEVFFTHFLPLFVSTVHKFQGGVIKGEYAILELDQYMADRNLVYTSITRCTDYKNIHIDHHQLKTNYYPTRHSLEVKDISSKAEEMSLYRIVYDCKCADDIKKEYVFADSNHELTKMTPELMKSNKINQKHKKCNCKITQLIKAVHMNNHMQDWLIKASDPNEQLCQITHHKVKIIKDFKENKSTRYDTKVYESKDRLRIIYYDDQLEKKEKVIKVTKCGLEEGKKKVNDFLKSNKLTLSWC
jgi:hypothetical protein